jgi:hypothetical protein
MTKPSRLPENLRAKYSDKNSFRAYVDTSGVGEFLWQLEDEINRALRPAAQAGAQVLYDDVKRNVSRINAVSGNLSNSIYQVYSKRKSSETKAVYEVSYNPRKAPHGHLVEWGFIQRYETVKLPNGKFITKVRPEMRGKPKPRKNASTAEKDAYYVLRDKPVQISAKPFMRSAISKFNEAMDAVKDRLIEELNK